MKHLKRQRTHYSQLPESGELKEILDKEAKRLPPKEKEKAHFPSFKLAIEWLDKLNLESTFFSQRLSPREVLRMDNKIQEVQKRVAEETFSRVRCGDSGLLPLLENITEYLGEEDKPKKSNIIMIFGSNALERVERGVDLWKKNIAPLILISGGQPNYEEERVPEAIRFVRHALSLGVPKDVIITESNSISIPDNVKTSLNLMDNFGINYKEGGITTVTAWFTQRRVWSHMMKFAPVGTKIFRVNVVISGTFAPNEWYSSEVGIRTIFNEFVKMRIAVLLNTA